MATPLFIPTNFSGELCVFRRHVDVAREPERTGEYNEHQAHLIEESTNLEKLSALVAEYAFHIYVYGFTGSFKKLPATVPPPPVHCGMDSRYQDTIQNLVNSGKPVRLQAETYCDSRIFRADGDPTICGKRLIRALPEASDQHHDWKPKLEVIKTVLNPLVKSLSFRPIDPAIPQVLFIQKGIDPGLKPNTFLEPWSDYVASEHDKHPPAEISILDANLISSQTIEQNKQEELSQIPSPLQNLTEEIIDNFTEDTETQALAVSFEVDDKIQRLILCKTPSFHTR